MHPTFVRLQLVFLECDSHHSPDTLWTSSSGSAVYEQQGAAELSQFHTNLAGFQDVLAQLAADKGLANYDSTDDLQTLLKNLVNAVKYLLNDLDEMVYNLPAVGPTLGPSKWSNVYPRVFLDPKLPQSSTTLSVYWMKSLTRWRTSRMQSSTQSRLSSRVSSAMQRTRLVTVDSKSRVFVSYCKPTLNL